MTVPATMEVGGGWNQTFESVSPGSSQKSKTVNRITSREMVTVPGGSFEAFRVDYDIETTITDQPPSVLKGTQWFVTGVGIVKSVAVIPMESGDIKSIESTIELVKRTTK